MAELLGLGGMALGAWMLGQYAMSVARERDRKRNVPRVTCHSCKRGRWRRSIEDEYLEVEQALEDIRRHDMSGCGMKLVCELSKLSPQQLTSDELAVLDLIREGEAGGGRSGGIRAYHAAKELGEWGGRCEAAFPGCPYNTQQIFNIVNLS